jgi:Gram-negative bacterial TonB protein C-terminal
MKKSLILFVSFVLLQFVSAQSVNGAKVDLPIGYDAVEVKPQFPGGISEFMKFVMKNYQVPEDEEGGGATGTVDVSIVIGPDGSLTNITILSDVGNSGKEIKRVLSKCPKWTPGRQNGANVSVIYNFPIKIQ